MTQQLQSRHTSWMTDTMYFSLKELAALRDKGHATLLVREIVADYINQHKNELLEK